MDRLQALENIATASEALRMATLAYSAHRSSCKSGCNQEGEECNLGGDLWILELHATNFMWEQLDVLKSLQPALPG